MKLAFVIQRYGADFVGGAEKYARSMAVGLAAQGHQVEVITSCATSYADWANDYDPGTTEDLGVTVHRVPVRAPRNNDRFIPLHLRAVDVHEVPLWPWAQDLWAQTMGPAFDGIEPLLARTAQWADVTVIVGYHYSQALWLTGLAAAHGPVALVPTAHPEGAFHVGRVRQMFQHADGVICLAEEEADLIADLHGFGDRTWVVPCPVEPLEPPTSSAIDAVLGPLGLTRGRYGIVVGRIDPAKGSDDAVRFATEYRRCVDPSFQLVVVGPGGDPSTQIDGVVATGFVDDPTKDALVAGSGVLIQPSYMESFSLALMEGWLLERPALVQRRSRVLAGHADRSGGGITYADYLDFEAALHTILTRPGLATDLGRQGRDYVRRQFAWPKVAAEFTTAIAQISEAGNRRLAATERLTRRSLA